MSSPTISGKFHVEWDATAIILTICSALSLYNALELILLIFTTFNRWQGLYFWSLMIASFGVILYCLGLNVEYFELTRDLVGKILDTPGWVMMITGQSFVLYSRLNLILHNPNILKAVKLMIILDGVILHIMTTVLEFGARWGGHQLNFALGYFYIEKIQMTIFCIQEFIISGLYVWKTIELLRTTSRQGTRRVMWQLFSINVIIIVMDIGLLVVEYMDFHVLEQSFKPFVYSVKLKLEFAILGKLVDLVKSSTRSLANALVDAEMYVDGARTMSEVTRVASQAQKSSTDATGLRWLTTLTKASVEHMEHVSNRPENGESVSPALEAAETTQRLPQPLGVHSPDLARRRTEPDADLMYAEALRSISSS